MDSIQLRLVLPKSHLAVRFFWNNMVFCSYLSRHQVHLDIILWEFQDLVHNTLLHHQFWPQLEAKTHPSKRVSLRLLTDKFFIINRFDPLLLGHT